MASWRSPGRAERVVVYEEGGSFQQYWRVEDQGGRVSWSKDSVSGAEKAPADGLTTEELLKAVEASLQERRRATRGRKFRL